MSVATEATTTASVRRRPVRAGALVCLFGAVAATAVVPLMGGLSADTGAGLTAELVDEAGRMQGAAVLAALAAAALLLAAVRLGRAVGGVAGAVSLVAGSAAALLMAAMYAAFASGAVVASMMLTDPSPAVGEGTLLMVNLVELTRYAPGTALLVAVLAARHALPRPLAWTAGLLLLLTVVPFTTWAVAIAVPVWLGVAGAVVGSRTA